jgi:hypothetical protein
MNGTTKSLIRRNHHDANQIFRLLVGQRIAAMIEDNPTILDLARQKVRDMAAEPHSGDAVKFWTDMLKGQASDVSAILARDDPIGDYARDTMPAFIALDGATMCDLVAESRRLFRIRGHES